MSLSVPIDAGPHAVDSILFDGVSVGVGARVSRCFIEKGIVIPARTASDVDFLTDAHESSISPNEIVVDPGDYSGWSNHSARGGQFVDEAHRVPLTTN